MYLIVGVGKLGVYPEEPAMLAEGAPISRANERGAACSWSVSAGQLVVTKAMNPKTLMNHKSLGQR